MPTRKPFVGGNWKMNLNRTEAVNLAGAVADGVDDQVDVAVFPPMPYVEAVGNAMRDSLVKLGAQDFYFERGGAFTGEVSLTMLEDLNVGVVLVGHSERRHVIGESDAIINRKVLAALDSSFELVLCVGETEAQRQADQTDAINTAQLCFALAGVRPQQMAQVTIAYEPVWAIGTGRTASTADAQSAHREIRRAVQHLFTEPIAAATRIVYGGSVKPDNARDLFAQNDIDGGLIGGASLKAADFLAIAHDTLHGIPT